MRQIVSTSDKLTAKNVINGISDIPGGISLVLSTLVAGAFVPEGTPISAPTDGKRTICKQAQLLAGSTTTALVVATETNHFKVGDGVMQVVGGASYDVDSVVDNGDGTTTVTVGTALESAAAGTWIYESSGAEGADTGALSNEADVILKHPFVAPVAATEVIYMVDGYIRADVVEDCIGDLYLATLPGVLEVKY